MGGLSDPPLPGVRPATAEDLLTLPAEVAPRLLGGVLWAVVDGDAVAVRLTEVEAYHGLGTGSRPDPGSHARSGPTARNATMWGPPGRLYVYLSHGLHSCVNVVCGREGVAGAVLFRAGEIVHGAAAARARRRTGGVVRSDRDLARGPGRLGAALGLRHPGADGIDALAETGSVRLWLPNEPVAGVRSGPRVGVAGIAGTDAFPWRFWIEGDLTVSPFRWGRGAASAATDARLGA